MRQLELISNQEIGRRLRLARLNREMTIAELCEQLGFRDTTLLEQYETGQAVISATHLKMMALVLDVPVEFLLHDQPLMDCLDDLQLWGWLRSLHANQRREITRLVVELATDVAISGPVRTPK